MTINRKQLLESLKFAMPGIENGNVTLQGADTFIFSNGNIYTYNDSVSVCVPISQTGLIEENIEGAVKAEEFFKVISKFPSDEINFAVTQNDSWILKSGKAKVEMTLIKFDYQTRIKEIEPKEEWVSLNDEFISGVTICKMAVNKTPMNGVYVKGSNIVSTDGWQMNRFKMEKTELPEFWISDSSVDELLKIKSFEEMQLNGNWVNFKTKDGLIISLKTLNTSQFPYSKVEKLLEVSQPKETDFHSKFPQELFNVIDRATSFGIDISERVAVRLVLSKDNIEVSSERASGKYSEKVDWEEKPTQEFEPITIYVDATMMEFIAKRSLEFYLYTSTSVPRMLFVTSQSIHLMSTLDNGN